MTRYVSLIVTWACNLALLAFPALALYYLVDISAFSNLVGRSSELPIIWSSISLWQWFLFWVLTVLYWSTAWCGLLFLRKAFKNFAKGEFFNLTNSRNLRLFAVFIFIQALAQPIHHAVASVVLSLGHPPGQKVLAISLGSGDIKVLFVAMILWVLSELLVEASKIANENKQFI